MRHFLLLTMICCTGLAFSQFKYTAWNIGIQTGKAKITNAFSKWEIRPETFDKAKYPQPLYYMRDSADASYNLIGGRFNIEAVRPNAFVKATFGFPIKKNNERDSIDMRGTHWEVDVKFAYGFVIKEKVGILFGANLGVFNLTQARNFALPGGFDKNDYYGSNLGLAPNGQKYAGNMASFQAGLNITNTIAFSDLLGMRTTLSYINLATGSKGKLTDLDMALYYSDTEKHNLGFRVGFGKNWGKLKSVDLDQPIESNAKDLAPAVKFSMTTVYVGVNIPIVFGD